MQPWAGAAEICTACMSCALGGLPHDKCRLLCDYAKHSSCHRRAVNPSACRHTLSYCMYLCFVAYCKIEFACLVKTCSYPHKQFPALASLPVCLQADNSSRTGMPHPPHPHATSEEAALGSADRHQEPAKGASARLGSSDNHARGREMLRVTPPWQPPPMSGLISCLHCLGHIMTQQPCLAFLNSLPGKQRQRLGYVESH